MRIMIRIKQTFNLILTLALWLTMAQTAWATTTTVTRTVTWKMDGGASGETTKTDGNRCLTLFLLLMVHSKIVCDKIKNTE